MRVECESCHELTVASFAIEGGAVVVTCAACHAKMTPPAASVVVPAPADVACCPKCGAPKTADPACRSCGLAADRMASFVESRDAAIPEVVRAAWQRVLDGWDQPSCHDDMLSLVSQHCCYAWAAGRYRDAQRARTADTVAERQLDRLRRSAEASLFVTAAHPDQARPYRNTIAIIGFIVLLTAVGLVYAMVFHDNHEQTAPPVSQPARP